MRSGIYPDMRPLRRHDELQDFFESFSNTIDAVRERDEDDLEAMNLALAEMSDGAAKEALQTCRDRKHESFKLLRENAEADAKAAAAKA